MTPEQFAQRFLAESSSKLENNNSCIAITNAVVNTEGLCGRFMKGTCEEHFDKLSDEPGKRLSWVCSGEMLQRVLGKNPVQALLSIGKTLDWIQCRIDDGTKFRLIVFSADVSHSKIVTWDNLWEMIATSYGPKIDTALEPFKEHIQNMDVTKGYTTISGGEEITKIANLPLEQRLQHPNHMSVKHFLATNPKTLYHARAFLHHSVGCNSRFTGTGKSPDGDIEMMTPNIPISDIPGAVMLCLDVTQKDLNEATIREEQVRHQQDA